MASFTKRQFLYTLHPRLARQRVMASQRQVQQQWAPQQRDSHPQQQEQRGRCPTITHTPTLRT